MSYFYDASKLAPFVVEYVIDNIELKKSDVNNLDLTKESVNVETKYHDGTTENEAIDMKYIPPKASDIDFNSSWCKQGDYGSNLSSVVDTIIDGAYLYITDYETYKLYENSGYVKGYSKDFFKDNMLVVNWLYCFSGSYRDYDPPVITIDKNNRLIFDYICNIKTPPNPWHIYEANIIEFKKSDVKDIDFSSAKVNVRKVYWYNDIPTENVSINMKHIKIDSPKDDKTQTTTAPTNKKPITQKVKKPVKVAKVKLKSPKKKQLKVTWKKIKGVKYQVQYSLKKNMKNAKTKKNIKKNSVTLKKLKSNKKYYVRVRAYKEINGKKYFGKWSRKIGKTVK